MAAGDMKESPGIGNHQPGIDNHQKEGEKMKTSKVNYTVLTAVALIIIGGGVAAFTGLRALSLIQEARKLDLSTMNYAGYSYRMSVFGKQISNQFAIMIGGLLGMTAGLTILGLIRQKKKAQKLQDQISISAK